MWAYLRYFWTSSGTNFFKWEKLFNFLFQLGFQSSHTMSFFVNIVERFCIKKFKSIKVFWAIDSNWLFKWLTLNIHLFCRSVILPLGYFAPHRLLILRLRRVGYPLHKLSKCKRFSTLGKKTWWNQREGVPSPISRWRSVALPLNRRCYSTLRWR